LLLKEISWLFFAFAPPALSREQPQRAICQATIIKLRARAARDPADEEGATNLRDLEVERVATYLCEHDQSCFLTNCVSRLVTVLGRNP